MLNIFAFTLSAAIWCLVEFCGAKKESIAYDEKGNELVSDKVYSLPSNITFTSEVSDTSTSDICLKLTATVKPVNATNQELSWNIAWQNAESDWATGKNISDYISMEKSYKTVTLRCLQAFGEPAKIVVRSEDNPEAKAECRLDYAKKYIYSILKIYENPAPNTEPVLLGSLNTCNYLDASVSEEARAFGCFHKSHAPAFNVHHFLDPQYKLQFEFEPVFSVGTVGDVEYTSNLGFGMVACTSLAFELHKDKLGGVNAALGKNLLKGQINVIQSSTDIYDRRVDFVLGSDEVRNNLLFYNGFLPSDAQIRDLVRFASRVNECVITIVFSGILKMNNMTYVVAEFFDFGIDETTLGVGVSDVTVDNSQLII